MDILLIYTVFLVAVPLTVAICFTVLFKVFHPPPSGPKTTGITIAWARYYDPFKSLLMKLVGGNTTLEEATLELADLSLGEIALDVGCGTGTLSILAKDRVGKNGQVHGIDASLPMIEYARSKVSGSDLDLQVGLIEDLKFPDDTFDIALSSLMMHHLPSADLKERGLAELKRVLKPGGRLLIVDFEPPTKGLLKYILTLMCGHHMMGNDIHQLVCLAETAGFKEVKVGRTSHKILSFVSGRA